MHNRKLRRKTAAPVLISVLCLAVLVIGIQTIMYITRPHIQYSSAKADCRPAAVTTRNEKVGSTGQNCLLTITAKNLKSTPSSVDWDGVGGGPFADPHPMIRISSPRGKSCYAAVDNPGMLGAHESRNLSLQCLGAPNKPPKNYDENSDQDPVLITISGYFDTQTFTVTPLR